MTPEDISQAVAAITARAAVGPKVAIILGSGLGPLAEDVDGAIAINYADIPGFPVLSVEGHAGRLVFGTISDTPVALLQGRKHYYETGDPQAMNLPLAVLNALGCETLLLSNASGALVEGIEPGDIALISDHINFAGVSPLIDEPFFDDKFVDLADAYDPFLRVALAQAATSLGFSLQEVVYTFFTGPQFETPAEIRATAALGGDLVGMSTVLEVIFARALGMRCAALSIVTNKAAGMTKTTLSHAHTQATAKLGEDRMRSLVRTFLHDLRPSL